MEAILHELVQLHGELQSSSSLTGQLHSKESLIAELSSKASIEGTIQPIDALPAYDGEYSVNPKFASQTLATKGKSMGEDVTVEPIYVASTINISGGNTVYIGGEINNG